MILSILKKPLRLQRPKLFSTELAVIKKTNIDSFLTIYIWSKTSKFIGRISKQDNNNNQTQVLSILQAETSEILVNASQIVSV
jgi:hypothetical protein